MVGLYKRPKKVEEGMQVINKKVEAASGERLHFFSCRNLVNFTTYYVRKRNLPQHHTE